MQKCWEGHSFAVPKKRKEPACPTRPRGPGKSLRCWQGLDLGGPCKQESQIRCQETRQRREGCVLAHVESLDSKFTLLLVGASLVEEGV